MMPRNNRRVTRAAGAVPTIGPPPNVIVRKTFEEALVAGYDNPVSFARDFLDLDPFTQQVEFLEQTRLSTEASLVAGNRVGKTWLGGVLLLWRAFYRFIAPHLRPPRPSEHVTYKAVTVSLTHDQAKLAWNYAMTFTESKRFAPFVADVVHSPFPTMLLRTKGRNGEWGFSEVWARSLAKKGVYLLGHSFGFVLVDECAYVPNYPTIEDEVIRMRLADQGGSLFRISTPNGRNHFFDYWMEGTKGTPGIYSQRITTWDNPTISRAVLEMNRSRMTAEYYAQNVMAEFVSQSDFFKMDQIQGLYEDVEYTDREGNPLEVQIPVQVDPAGTYVLGLDLGAARDPTVVYVVRVDVTPHQMVVAAENRSSRWETQLQWANTFYQTYRPKVSYVDATGVGAPIAQRLIEECGWENTTPLVFNQGNKLDALVKLQDAIQRRRFVFPYVEATKELVRQLGFYRLDDKHITQDHVLALTLMNLALEASQRQEGKTVFYDDLRMIDFQAFNQSIAGPDDFGPGVIFDYNPSSGLLLPKGRRVE